jgi:glucokinase
MVEESRRLLEAALKEREGGAALKAIGISGGGPLDPETGTILSVPNLPGWLNIPITRILSERLGAPAFLENDANACAVAEWLYGAGKGSRHLCFLTCSTGIGAGLILDGRLFRGSRFLAGEAGHQVIIPDGLPCGCGKRGCLEAYASGAGMARRLAPLREKDPTLPATARDVVERAQRGDEFSAGFLRETADYLAMGLANVVFLLNPQRIVLGTIPASAGEWLFKPLRESLSRRLWPSLLEGLEVVPSALWPDLGDHAALAVARDLSRSRL